MHHAVDFHRFESRTQAFHMLDISRHKRLIC